MSVRSRLFIVPLLAAMTAGGADFKADFNRTFDGTAGKTIVRAEGLKGTAAWGKDSVGDWAEPAPASSLRWPLAADYYDIDGQHSAIEDEDCRAVERTYHLLRAGRYVDACKVIERHLYAMVLSDDREFYETVRDVPTDSIKDRFMADFLTLRAELALSQNDLKTAREASEKLVTVEGGQEYGYACLTECLILRKQDRDAADMIKKVNGSGNALGMVKLAEAYLDLGDLQKAEEEMDAAVRIISDNNVAAVAQRFLVQARIDAAKGLTDDANRHISKAYVSTNEIGKRNVKAVAKSLGLSIS